MSRYWYGIHSPEYAWAAGWDVADAALKSVEFDIGEHNTRIAGQKVHRVGVSSPPLNPFPVKAVLMSGAERGDGMITQEWTLTLATGGVKYILDEYLSGGTVASVKMTIRTRRHESFGTARYNCWLALPRGEDLQYQRQNVFKVRLRFLNLQAL